METVEILEQLFDTKMLAVLKHFINNEKKQFYLREVAKSTRLPPATTYRILGKLIKLNILKKEEIKNLKLYHLEDNKKTEFLKAVLKIEKRVIDSFVDSVKVLPGVKSIILHGKEQKDRANLLLIGTDIDGNEVKRLCAEIKEKYSFTVSSLSLTEAQYEQMSSMGLFSGDKVELYAQR